MGNANTIQLTISVDDKGSPVIQQFGKTAGTALSEVDHASKSASSQFLQMATAMGVGTTAADLLKKAIATAVDIFKKGFNAVDDYNQNIASLAAMVTTFSERQKGITLEQQWRGALAYSSAMVPILENIAAKTLLSGQETTTLANAFARSGVFLDASNAKQIESFTRISNALPLMTQGQAIMMQINQEIRGLMTGTNQQNSMMLQTLKAIDPQIENHLKLWRNEGTVLEHIGDLLSGFGPATSLLENQWQAVKSTIDTTVTQVLRAGMLVAYGEIIQGVQGLNALFVEQKGTISAGISVAWSMVANTIIAIWNALSGFGPILKDVGQLVGVIAYGWGGVLAALKPIGEFLGNSISLTYELAKMIGNAVVAAGALATGQLSVAKVAWDEAKKNFKQVEVLSQKNRDILTDGIADSIVKYDLQTKAALASGKTIYNATANFKAKEIEDNEKAEKEKEKIRKQAEKATVEEIRKAYVEIDGYGKTAYEKEIIRIDSEAAEKEKAGVAAVTLAKWYTAETTTAENKMYDEIRKLAQADFDLEQKLKKEEKAQAEKAAKEATRTAAEKLTAERQLYKDLKNVSGLYYQGEKALINAEAAHRRELLLKGVSDRDEVAKLTIAIEAAKQEKLRLLDIEEYKRSNDFFAGIKAGYLELHQSATTWGQVGLETFKTFTSASGKELSTFLEDTWQRKLQGAGDYATAIFDSVRKTFFDMMGKMAAEKVMLFFETTWTSGGANVLGIIDKVLGLTDNLFNGGGGNNTDYSGNLTNGMGLGEDAGFAHGGWIPGSAAFPGNNPANDKVRFWGSPGEYVVDRERIAAMGQNGDSMIAHINPEEAALLKLLGGSGTINPRTGLPQFFGFGDFTEWFGDVVEGVGGLGDSLAQPLAEVGAMALQAWAAYVTSGLSAAFMAAGSTDAAGGSQQDMLKSAIIAAAVAYMGKQLGGAFGPESEMGAEEALAAGASRSGADTAGTQAYLKALEQGLDQAAAQEAYNRAFEDAAMQALMKTVGEKTAKDYISKYALNALYGEAGGGRGRLKSMSYMGANDGGALGSLHGMLSDIAPQKRAYSAFSGLDYVPRDNFLVDTHKAEAILPADEAAAYRAGKAGRDGAGSGAGRPVIIHIHNEIGGREFNSYIYNESKNGTLRLHERGIVDK